jgi:hypothetical protein
MARHTKEVNEPLISIELFDRVQEILNGRFTTKQMVSRQALPQKSAKGVTEPLAVASGIKTQFNLTELAQYL